LTLQIALPVQRNTRSRECASKPGTKTAMGLTLQLVNETTLPDGGPVSVHISGRRGIDIGRAAHLDWCLPDPTRYISSKHCEIRYKDGGYWLHDVSTNGTFLNGADHRMHEPHRLRNGDRFMVGQYIVAATVEDSGGEAARPLPESSLQAHVANDQDWWDSDGEVPPPINPKELRPARSNAPVNPDFLDWAANVPDPWQGSESSPDNRQLTNRGNVSDRSNASNRSNARSSEAAMDWAEGPPSRAEIAPPPPPPAPTPRRPGITTRDETEPVRVPSSTPASPRSPAASEQSSLGYGSTHKDMGHSGSLIGQLAAFGGLPEDLVAQRDPEELAEQIGKVLRLVVENLMQLLNARQQAKRLAQSAHHTVIQSTNNNPLKFCPSAEDALRIMFGPNNPGYLDAERAIVQGFTDLKAHELKTYAAIQHALMRLMADLDPKKIAADTNAKAGSGWLSSLRKAELWDAYQARWDTNIGKKGSDPIQAFMRYFAEFYDRDAS
jgi:type VI secretion system protein ImpI